MKTLKASLFLLILIAIVSLACRRNNCEAPSPSVDPKIVYTPVTLGAVYTYSSSLLLPGIIDTTLTIYQTITGVSDSSAGSEITKIITFGWSDSKGASIGETRSSYTASNTAFTRYVPGLQGLERGVALSRGYQVISQKSNVIYPILRLPHNYSIGDIVIQKEVAVISDTVVAQSGDGNSRLITLNRTDSAATVTGTEALTIPGSTTQYDCLKVQGKAHFSFVIKGEAPWVNSVVTNTYWFARGIGLVKMQAVATKGDGTTWIIYSSNLLSLTRQ
jgi:hypothetical protein